MVWTLNGMAQGICDLNKGPRPYSCCHAKRQIDVFFKFSIGVTFSPWQHKNFVRTFVFVDFLYFYFMLPVSFRRN